MAPRDLAGDALPEQDGKRIHIDLLRGIHAVKQLRRHVRRRARLAIDGAHKRPILELGDAKVADLGPAIRIQKHVLRLEIPVNNVGMQVHHRLGDVDGESDDRPGRQGPASILRPRHPVQLGVQRSTLRQLLNDANIGGNRACCQKCDNVGVPEAGQDGNLLTEGIHLPAVGRVRRLQDLDGHRMPTPFSLEDGAKRSRAELLVEDDILGKVVWEVVDGRWQPAVL